MFADPELKEKDLISALWRDLWLQVDKAKRPGQISSMGLRAWHLWILSLVTHVAVLLMTLFFSFVVWDSY
jgi:hypothetical protein